jgi:hypothetical protein
MKIRTALLVASAAGCCAPALAQSQPSRPAQPPQTLNAAAVIYDGVRYPARPVVADDVAIVYDSTGGAYQGFNAPAGYDWRHTVLDNVSLTPGPGAGQPVLLTGLTLGFIVDVPQPAGFDIIVTFYDNYANATPVNTTPIASVRIPFGPATTPGAYASNPIDLTVLPEGGIQLPDDLANAVDWAVVQTDTTTLEPGVRFLIAQNAAAAPGGPPAVGNSDPGLVVDIDGDGVYANTEAVVTTGYTSGSNLYLQLMGAVTPSVTGACCLPGGVCTLLSDQACRAQGGIYSGDNSTCAAAACGAQGACCLLDGTCTLADLASCVVTSNGIFRGAGTTCAAGSCPSVFSYTGGPLQIGDGDSEGNCGLQAVATIVIPAASAFTVTGADAAFNIPHTWQGDVKVSLKHVETGTTVLMVNQPGGGNFNADNFGASTSDVDLFRSRDSAAGIYNLPFQPAGIDNVRGQWKPEASLTAFSGESSVGTWQLIAEDCFAGDTGTLNAFKLSLAGSAAPQACYANCDASTTAPVLNVLDFNCFLNRFSAGASYANCDASTTAPVLNVLDFNCFLNRFTAGCTAP